MLISAYVIFFLFKLFKLTLGNVITDYKKLFVKKKPCALTSFNELKFMMKFMIKCCHYLYMYEHYYLELILCQS